MRLRLAVLLSVLVVAPSAARAATITVNTTSQTVGVDGLCSLPEALASAGGGSTGGDCTPGADPGMDDIVLPSGTLHVSSIALNDVRLLGQGAGTTVLDAGGTSTVLTTGGTVELHDLTATHGQAPSHAFTLPGDDGGGIHEISGSLTIIGCAITDNVAGSGGQGADHTGTGDYGLGGGNGGGIYVSAGATLNVTTSTISGNRAGAGGAGGRGTSSSGSSGQGGGGGGGGWGGGVYVDGNATATIDRSTIAGNVAGDGGTGGIGTGDVSGTGGLGGFGGAGGGIASVDGKITITASSITGNHGGGGGDGGEGDGSFGTTGSGVGGDGGTGGSGGGLMFAGSTPQLSAATNITVAGNGAGAGGDGGKGLGGNDGVGGHGANVAGHGAIGGYGGGIGIVTVPVGLLHDTVVNDQVGAQGLDYGATTGPGAGQGAGLVYSGGAVPSTIAKSIVSGCHGTPNDLGFNLGTDGCPGSGADPELGPLQDNGGPVQTMRPGPGSPAVNAIPSDQGCAASDARGVPRPIGTACDIGAVELAPPTAVTMDPSGATLNGTVDGHGLATKVTFDYGQSTAYGASLTALPTSTIGPLAESVTLGPMLAGTYHYRVAATNGDGAGFGADKTVTITGQPPPGGGSAPVLTRLSFKPRRLRRGHTATVRFTITEAASVRLTFARRSGRRYRAAGSLTRRVRAGAAKLTFRRRALKPGRYRLTLVATDAAARRSRPVSTTFTVVAA